MDTCTINVRFVRDTINSGCYTNWCACHPDSINAKAGLAWSETGDDIVEVNRTQFELIEEAHCNDGDANAVFAECVAAGGKVMERT